LRGGNIITATEDYRIEPVMLVDNALATVDWMPTVSTTMLNVFTSFWMQAADAVCNISEIRLGEKLGPLSPNRSWSGESASQKFVFDDGVDYTNPELYQHALPTHMALEADRDDRPSRTVTVNKEYNEELRAAVNLAVGRVVEVTASNGATSKIFPVSVRLLASYVPTSIVQGYLKLGSKFLMDIGERWRLMRMGILSRTDFFFFLDIMRERRRLQISDKNNAVSEVLARARKGVFAGMMTGKPSIGTMSNILLIHDSTLKSLEGQLGGSIFSSSFRQDLFNGTALMLIGVINPDEQRLTLFYVGYNQHTVMSLREMKTASEKSPDIAEMMKMFIAGQPPSF
jgi:hypothetical protein